MFLVVDKMSGYYGFPVIQRIIYIYLRILDCEQFVNILFPPYPLNCEHPLFSSKYLTGDGLQRRLQIPLWTKCSQVYDTFTTEEILVFYHFPVNGLINKERGIDVQYCWLYTMHEPP